MTSDSRRAICKARVASVAGYVPPRILTNADLEKMVDTNQMMQLQNAQLGAGRGAPPATPAQGAGGATVTAPAAAKSPAAPPAAP